MKSEDINPIVSEEYADLIIDNTLIDSILKKFPGVPVHTINFQLSLVNIPVEFITDASILELGYATFPGPFGLVSQGSLEATGIQRLRSIPNFNLRGQGVLIGILDTGIDYTNPIFRNADGTTRIASIWDQTIQSGNPPEGYFYGTQYSKEQINLALQNDNPLEIVPSTDENGHGTMLAGIAGGNEVPESDFYGVATDSEFVIVKMKPMKKYLKDFLFIPEESICYQENDISFALDYLLDVSTRLSRPLAICVAVNTSEGPHDGRGTLSTYLSLVASTPGVSMIVAAGNEGNAKRHFYGIAEKTTEYVTVELNVGENEGNFCMQLWGHRPNLYSVAIISPSGENSSIITTSINDFRELRYTFEATVIYLDIQIAEAQSGDQLIMFRFKDPTPGIWKINVYERGDLRLGFNIWLPMQGFISDNTYFIHSDPYITVLTLGTTTLPITVTAYNHADDSLYLESSRGYSRTDFITPQIAAPGVNITGPTLNNSFAEYTGTSVSAAHTTGVAAMLLEWGVVKGNLPNMSSVEMKILMERGARRNLNIEYPNRDWGYGILDIYNIYDSLRVQT